MTTAPAEPPAELHAGPPAAPLPVPEGWEGILEPGEQVLWQGRPTAGLHWRERLGARTVFGLAYAGFALFWIFTAAVITSRAPTLLNLLFPLAGVPFLLIGLNLAIGKPLREARQRRQTFYTLTDRAAFIATTGPKRLDRYPLDASLRPVLEDGNPGSVWFAETGAGAGRGWHGRGTARRYTAGGRSSGRIGFEAIPDARAVYAQMLTALRARVGGDDRGENAGNS
jgi:hypothetical protein